MKPLNFSTFIKNRIANIKAADNFAFATAIGVGPWPVPLGPAIIFGYALHKSSPADMAEFRIVAAVAVAIGLIVAGAVSSHNAIAAGGWRPWSLVSGYILLEITGLWLMSVGTDVKIAGTVASLLTLIVYLSRSSAKELDLTRDETKEAAQTKLDFQMRQAEASAEHKRTMEQEAGRLKHAERLAKIEGQAGRQPSGNLPATANQGEALPEWLPTLPASADHFRQLIGSGVAILPDNLSGAELGRIIGKSARTGQNWLAEARNGK